MLTRTIIPKRYKSEFKPLAGFVETSGEPIWLEKSDSSNTGDILLLRLNSIWQPVTVFHSSGEVKQLICDQPACLITLLERYPFSIIPWYTIWADCASEVTRRLNPINKCYNIWEWKCSSTLSCSVSASAFYILSCFYWQMLLHFIQQLKANKHII